MQVLFYSPQFLPSVGGLQNVVHYWAEYLGRKGHHITVVCTTAGTGKEIGSYQTIRYPSFWKTVELMKHADLVVMFNVSLKVIPQLLLSRTPLVISHHTAFRYADKPITWQQHIKRWVANRLAVANIACSTFIAKDYRACITVPNPFNEQEFYNRDQPRQSGSLLFVGRLVTDKGIELLLKALAILHQTAFVKHKLNIIGTGPQEQELKTLCTSLKIEEEVTFSGSMDTVSVAEAMNRYEILVVPSLLEPFGLVVLEGLSCGCRLVVSNQGGLPEAGGNLVHYFESGSVDNLVSAIQQAVSQPIEITAEEKAAHLQQFRLQQSAASLEEALLAIINR